MKKILNLALIMVFALSMSANGPLLGLMNNNGGEVNGLQTGELVRLQDFEASAEMPTGLVVDNVGTVNTGKTEYTVTLKFKDDATGTPINNASVVIGDNTYTTTNGTITLDTVPGTYNFTVKADGYQDKGGSVEVTNVAVAETVEMEKAKYTITFNITDGTDPINNASIAIGDKTFTTTNGTIEVDTVAGIYNYVAKADGYQDKGGSVEVTNAAVTETVEMEEAKYDITFTAKDGSTPLENVSIEVGEETKTTNSDGQAIFNLADGDYTYTAKLDGYGDLTADFTVAGAEQEITLAMVDAITPAKNIFATVDGLNANISWDIVYYFAESFEESVPPADWEAIVTCTPEKTWMQKDELVFMTTTLSPQEGDYFAFLNWVEAHQDEWLITPEISILPESNLNFYSYTGAGADGGSTHGDHYYVKISTDGGNTWTELWDAVTSGLAGDGWKLITIDLTDYVGQDVKLAWQGVDGPTNDGLWFVWGLDNIKVSLGSKTMAFNMKNNSFEVVNDTKSFQGYNVYVDDQSVLSGTTETTYTAENLSIGSHTASVEKVYTAGTSDKVSVEFEIAEPTYKVTFNVKSTVTGNPAVEGATISVNNQEIPTNANGVAEIELKNGSYDYTVTKDDFKDTTGSVTVDGAVQTVDVMIEPKIANCEIELSALVAPNPTNGLFKVQIEGTYSLKVVDASGETVYETEMTDLENVDITNQKAGIYFVTINNGTQTATYKIIKK